MKDKLEGQQLKTSKHERWIWRDNRGNIIRGHGVNIQRNRRRCLTYVRELQAGRR